MFGRWEVEGDRWGKWEISGEDREEGEGLE